MDLFLWIIGPVLILFLIVKLAEDHDFSLEYGYVEYISIIVLSLSMIGIHYVGNYYSEEEVTVYDHVLEYENILYSEPKQITETKTIYPFWSGRDDLEYEVVLQQQK